MRILLPVCIFASMIFVSAVGADAATIVNGGFNGNLDGWQQHTDTTVPHGDPNVATAVVDSLNSFTSPSGDIFTPTEGTHFAYLEAMASGTPQEFALTPHATLGQIFDVEANDRIVGDYFAWLWKDGATSSSEFSIVLMDGAAPNLGAPLATLVHPRTWPGEDTIESVHIPWTQFEYTFQAAGMYWLETYVQAHNNATTGAAQAFGGVDNIRFEAATPIPEPSSLAAWAGLGLVGGFVGWRRRRKT